MTQGRVAATTSRFLWHGVFSLRKSLSARQDFVLTTSPTHPNQFEIVRLIAGTKWVKVALSQRVYTRSGLSQRLLQRLVIAEVKTRSLVLLIFPAKIFGFFKSYQNTKMKGLFFNEVDCPEILRSRASSSFLYFHWFILELALRYNCARIFLHSAVAHDVKVSSIIASHVKIWFIATRKQHNGEEAPARMSLLEMR